MQYHLLFLAQGTSFPFNKYFSFGFIIICFLPSPWSCHKAYFVQKLFIWWVGLFDSKTNFDCLRKKSFHLVIIIIVIMKCFCFPMPVGAPLLVLSFVFLFAWLMIKTKQRQITPSPHHAVASWRFKIPKFSLSILNSVPWVHCLVCIYFFPTAKLY